MLSKREREFIQDWFKVVNGEMEKIEFYKKWGSKKNKDSFLDDYKRVLAGKMTYKDFNEKWVKKGEWKSYIRVMRHRLKKKFEKSKKDFEMLQKFFKLDEMP
ncbi:MAG: hypothetical protein J7K36_03345 [Archaeoglobaceae archaeon]|nr:hypothetical protein [Archaeoglobaceae archaeon]HDD35883.1 hypothetical protein [Archaeoglobus veneficus]